MLQTHHETESQEHNLNKGLGNCLWEMLWEVVEVRVEGTDE